MSSILYRRLMPHLLPLSAVLPRLALAALALLILAGGAGAFGSWRVDDEAAARLARARQARMQDAQALLEQALWIEHDSAATDAPRARHAGLLQRIDAFERQLERRADDATLGPLREAGRLLRDSAPGGTRPAQAAALTAAARARIVAFADDEREALQRGLEGARRERLWLLATLGCSWLLAWLAWLAGHRATGRAAQRGVAPRMASAQDELGDLARAVGHFLQDRQRLEQSSAELRAVKERLALRNQQLQQEALVRLQAEHELRGLMTQQQTILDNVGVGIAFLKERRIIRCNESFAATFGYTQAELCGMSTGPLHVSELAYRETGDAAYAAVEIARTLSGDVQLKRRDGSVFWVERTLTAIDRNDLSLGAIWVVRDIDQRKRAEALRVEQGGVLEMIAAGMPLDAVLGRLAQMVEAQCGGMLASVLLLDEDGRRLRLGAAPGLPAAWVEVLTAGMPVGSRGGPCGVAIDCGQAVLVADTLDDARWDGWRALAAPHDWRACWSTPILSRQRKALGTLELYASHPRAPQPAETQLMEMASRLAGIAIERQYSEQRIRHMAHHDALTGLPNRTLLADRLDQALAYARRHGRTVTVAFIDLDNFKLINDSLGHNAGDALLKTVAQRMLGCVRGSDTVVRLGGDEFVIVLCDQADPAGQAAPVTRMLQQIRDAVARPVQLGGQQLQVSCSMGLASYPADGADGDTLLMNADAAMYRAKELGRNNFQFYTSTMNIRAHERLALQDGLRRALEQHQFRLLYQPQRDLRSGRMTGVEALIRWQHPELGMLAPADFIALAEESGLSVPIGEWVLQTACRQNRAWQDAGMEPVIMSVNLSAAQFRESKLVGQVAQALRDSGLAPRYLELELTEGLIMQDIGQAAAVMTQLQELGVRLAIDDFGTGYSSLAALKRFPVVRLKIDQSFVRDLPDNEDDRAIATAVIALAHKLNMKVIAEGVETDRQQAFLCANDCDEMQGYHFSEPVCAEALGALFGRAAGAP